MATNTIAGTAPRPAISELRLPWIWAFLAVTVMVGSLGFLFLRLSEQVNVANSYVLQLEAQLRSEQARGNSLRADIAQMQTMERLTTAASSRLRMREASSQGVAYVSAPDYIARTGTTYTGASQSRQVVAASILVDRPGQTAGRQGTAGKNIGTTQARADWLAIVATAFAPAKAAASEGDIRR